MALLSSPFLEGHRRRNSVPTTITSLTQQFFDPSSAETNLISPPVSPIRKSSTAAKVLPIYTEKTGITINSRAALLTPTKCFSLLLIALAAVYLSSFLPPLPESLHTLLPFHTFQPRAQATSSTEFFDAAQRRLLLTAVRTPRVNTGPSLAPVVPELEDSLLHLDQNQMDSKALPRPDRRVDNQDKRELEPEELIDQEGITGGKNRGGRKVLDPKLGLARITMMNRLQRLQGKGKFSGSTPLKITATKMDSLPPKRKLMKFGAAKSQKKRVVVEAFDEGKDLGEDEGDE